MPSYLRQLFFIILFLLAGPVSYACEINIYLPAGPEVRYSAGDTLVFRVDVVLTHRRCPAGINSTEFIGEGLEVIGTTAWQKMGRLTYESEVEAVVTEKEKNQAFLHARRTCNKEGGYGMATVPLTPGK